MPTPANTEASQLTTLTIDGDDVVQLLSIDGPKSTVDEYETTAQGDTAKTFRPSGIYEAGTYSIKVRYNPAEHARLTELLTSPETVPMVITTEHLTTYTFDGFLKTHNFDAMMDIAGAAVGLECELRIDGALAVSTPST